MKYDEFKYDFDFDGMGSSDSASSGADGWSVAWADLMMVMFVLFVVLFIYSQSKENIKVIFSANVASPGAVKPVDGLIDMISFQREAMSANSQLVLTPQDVLYRTDDGAVSMNEEKGEMKIVMRGDAFFNPGKSAFKQITLQYLGEVADVLKTSNYAVHIMGHTDSADESAVGNIAVLELSAMRAARVAQYFISKKSIDPRRIIVSGRGGSGPEVPDSLEQVSGNNRRVEIIVINPGSNN